MSGGLPKWDGATFPMPSAGEQTAPFTPSWTTPQPAANGRYYGRRRAPAAYGQSFKAQAERAAADEPCRCGLCPKPDPDCKDAILSCAPGVVTRMASERVRNGQWDDIPAYGREAGLRVSKPAVDNLARIRTDAEHGRLDMSLLFDRTPDLHHHWALRAGLRLAERVLAAQLAAMRQERQEADTPRVAPRTIAEMGAAVDITAAIGAERLAAS